jgi:hypothetical protein
VFALPSDASQVAVGDLLLYLCAVPDAAEGLRRAWQMCGGTLTVDDAFRVLHHDAPGAAGSVLPYEPSADRASRSQIAALYGMSERLQLQHLAASADGAAVLDTCVAYTQRVRNAPVFFFLLLLFVGDTVSHSWGKLEQ